MTTKNYIKTDLLHDFHAILTTYYYPQPVTPLNDFGKWCHDRGCTTNMAIIELIEYFKARNDEKLRNHRICAQRLEKNLMKIVKDNSRPGMDPCFGFFDGDLTDPRFANMGFSLFSIEYIHWFCLASGWKKEPFKTCFWHEDGCIESYIDIWVPPSTHFKDLIA
jgi:hypothetical protein